MYSEFMLSKCLGGGSRRVRFRLTVSARYLKSCRKFVTPKSLQFLLCWREKKAYEFSSTLALLYTKGFADTDTPSPTKPFIGRGFADYVAEIGTFPQRQVVLTLCEIVKSRYFPKAVLAGPWAPVCNKISTCGNTCPFNYFDALCSSILRRLSLSFSWCFSVFYFSIH